MISLGSFCECSSVVNIRLVGADIFVFWDYRQHHCFLTPTPSSPPELCGLPPLRPGLVTKVSGFFFLQVLTIEYLGCCEVPVWVLIVSVISWGIARDGLLGGAMPLDDMISRLKSLGTSSILVA